MPTVSHRRRIDVDVEQTTKVDSGLLDILVCPVTGDELVYDSQAHELVSKAAGLAYPIRDGIPVMLPEEARTLEKGKALAD